MYKRQTSYYFFNTQKEPFDNVLVRQAIRYAIDVDAMVEAVYEDLGEPAYLALNPALLDLSEADIQRYEYKPEKAKELLAEAGYPDGFSFEIVVSDQQPVIDMTEIIQAMLGDVGIDVKVNITEFSAMM